MADYYWSGAVDGDIGVAGNYLLDDATTPSSVVPGVGDHVTVDYQLYVEWQAPEFGESLADWDAIMGDLWGGTFRGTVAPGIVAPLGPLEFAGVLDISLNTGEFWGAILVSGTLKFDPEYIAILPTSSPLTVTGELLAVSNNFFSEGPFYASTSAHTAQAADIRQGITNLESVAGTLTLPAEADVRENTQYGGGGNEFTGTLSAGGEPNYPAEANVRDGVPYGDDLEGTLDLPPEADVKVGVQFDNQTKTGSAPTLSVEVTTP